MYPPAYFSDSELDAALEVARATRFATIVTIDGGSILPVHVPVSLRSRDSWRDARRPEFVGHVVTSNPLFDLLQNSDVPATVIFQPAEGYVSPGIYDEKQRSGRVVPTWNYVAAHFQGALHLEQGEGDLRRILETQIADYEGAAGGTWCLDDAPTDYIDKMAAAIAGFSFTATGWKTIRKLSQNKPDERQNVTRWLDDHALPASSISYWMRKGI
ncbi:MAG: FMN-binding negative transcriptional regulator [Proteobacteria bacterium]|nr:FMN-binding negative transcriptional regulator [Pseudomonadota bacterium]